MTWPPWRRSFSQWCSNGSTDDEIVARHAPQLERIVVVQAALLHADVGRDLRQAPRKIQADQVPRHHGAVEQQRQVGVVGQVLEVVVDFLVRAQLHDGRDDFRRHEAELLAVVELFHRLMDALVEDDGVQRDAPGGGLGDHFVVAHPLGDRHVPALGHEAAQHQPALADVDEVFDVAAQALLVEAVVRLEGRARAVVPVADGRLAQVLASDLVKGSLLAMGILLGCE